MADQILKMLYESGNNGTKVQCLEKIQQRKFYQYLIIPSAFFTLMFSMMWKRQNKFQNLLKGRPALVYPMDIMGRTNRFSYAAAFGSMASLCTNIVIYGELIIDYSGPNYWKSFLVMLTILVYGIAYLPLFTSLTVHVPAGYAIGSLYAWMFLAVKLYMLFRCEVSPLNKASLFLHGVPELLCLVYLSVSLPWRLGKKIRKIVTDRGSSYLESAESEVTKIGKSYQGIWVKKLLKKQQEKEERPPTSTLGNILAVVRRLRRKCIYNSNPNFRYSARFLSVILICIIILYQTAVFVLIIGFRILLILEAQQELSSLLLNVLVSLKVTLSISAVVACAIGIIVILHTMTSYRKTMISLYKGNHRYLPAKETKSNATLLLGCIRYAGYQVGYTLWAFCIQFLLCFLFIFLLAMTIILIDAGYGYIFMMIFMYIWPTLLVPFILNIVQILMVRYLFLQDSTNSLAIDNRRGFLIVVYFMFFYNSFIGFFNCLKRIIINMGIGAVFIARLDRSTLPMGFEFLDPGFMSYLGLVYTEEAHTHPVAVIFTRLLLVLCQLTGRQKNTNHYQYGLLLNVLSQQTRTRESSLIGIDLDVTSDEYKTIRRHRKAKNKWMMLYTLHSNPDLRYLRKTCTDGPLLFSQSQDI